MSIAKEIDDYISLHGGNARDALNVALAKIKQMEDAALNKEESKIEWIKAEDSEPEEHEDVLVIYYNDRNGAFPKLWGIAETSFYEGRYELEKEIIFWCSYPEVPDF